MTKKLKTIIENPWVIGSGTGVISTLFGSLVVDWVHKTPILTSLFKLLEYDLKVWWVLIFIIITYLSKILFSSFRHQVIEPIGIQTSLIDEYGELTERGILDAENQYNRTQSKVAVMLDYTADKFDGLVWNWQWRYNSLLKRHEPKNALPVCGNTDCQDFILIFDGYLEEFGCYVYRCHSCSNTVSTMAEPSDIERQVEAKYY